MFDLIKQIETKSYILKREANQIKNESKIAILILYRWKSHRI